MFYDKLKELCDKKGVKPSRVAIECGFSKGTVSHWKNDGTVPQREILTKIASYFGVSIDYLLGNEQKENPLTNGSKGTLSETNIIRIAGRDGRYIEKRLTDEQVKALEALIDQLPEAPEDL